MEFTKKVNLESEKYNQLKEITIQGVKVKGSLSPYDTPRQADVSYDEAKKEYRIHLIYLTPDEPKDEMKASPELSMFLGRTSGKLYDIVVRGQDTSRIVDVKFKITSGLANLERESERAHPPNYIKEFNLSLAKKLLEENQELYALAG